MELLWDIPPVSRCILAACVTSSLLTSFYLVTPSTLAFVPARILQGEVWRLLTSFAYIGNFGVSYLIQILLLYKNTTTLEMQSGKVQYTFFLMLMAAALLCLGLLLPMPFPSEGLLLAIVYVYCRRHSHVQYVLFPIPFKVPSNYIPFLLLVLNPDYERLFGILLAHTYHYFEDIYPHLPRSRGVRFLQAPSSFARLFP